ncbi:DNA-binding Lrp family transcriptional regulator [Frondihabitans sp. PhB188]|uniref:Lrp/AsnC family transcriptional regulator n=1 Tax=Frondihabitans sp. PhB188 TaxID=2485200 RepID=UPI000F4A5CCE|nr:Lrp/AsnC family transcriptional regulator [Frondihabitans sp. PhB188]ROQ39730.1 DNA-binding Lrp family transcriptional regulator [Frondihabitans sp. PhB188]
MTVDPLDARLILALDADPDATVVALAAKLGVSRNTVHARLKRMVDGGTLGAQSRRVHPAALGRPLTAFVSIALSQADEEHAVAGLAALPEVIELHAITGESDMLARVVAATTEDLRRVTGAILRIRGVVRTNTTIALTEVLPMRLGPLLEREAAL